MNRFSQFIAKFSMWTCVILCPMMSQAQQAQPVGFHGGQGANRRTITNLGRVGVRGMFTEPANMAADSVFWAHRDSTWTFTKPTPYIGGGMSTPDGRHNTVMIDFGLAYQVNPHEFDTNLPANPRVRSGWSILMLFDGQVPGSVGQFGVPVDDPFDPTRAWRIPRGSLGDCHLSFEMMQNGDVSFVVDPPLQTPEGAEEPVSYKWEHTIAGVIPRAGANMTWAERNRLFVKRVTGMTQPAPRRDDPWAIGSVTFDNSFFSDCRWRNGEVRAWDTTQNAWAWREWEEADTYLGTGLARASGMDYHGRDGQNNWAIDFGGADARNAAGATRHNPDRYSEETVRVSLLRGQRPPARTIGQRARRALNRPRLGF